MHLPTRLPGCFLVAATFAFSVCNPAIAQDAPAGREPEVVRLWPGTPPGGSLAKTPERTFPQQIEKKRQLVTISVSEPTMTVMLPPPGKANGTAMVVAPGGGFVSLVWDLEGTEVAEWLNARGVTVFVLKYRVSLPEANAPKPADMPEAARMMEPKRRLAVADAKRAITLIRQGAARWGIDPKRVGMMGFSAGAFTTMGAVLEGNAEERPDFAAPIYGAALLDTVAPPADAPPLFIVHAQDDALVPPSASTAIFNAWDKAKRPAELHIYAAGGHGFGMRAQGLPVDRWPSDFEAWLSSRGLIESTIVAKPASTESSPAQLAAPTRYSISETAVGILIDNPATRAIVDKFIPGLSTSDQIAAARSLTLKEIQGFAPEAITDQMLSSIEEELAKL